MTLGEILVKPTEAGREDLCRTYTRALTHGAILLPFDERVAPVYAQVRRDRTIRPPDAVQLACAGYAGVDLFITNDARLSRKTVSGIHFITALDAAPL
jgi:predicted nucleic acid-binding protein